MTNEEIINHPWVVIAHAVQPKPEVIRLVKIIIESHVGIRNRRIYISEDSRGQFICDNFDYPSAILLAHHDEQGYTIHSCSHHNGKYCTEEVASEGAKSFFTPLGENVFFNLDTPAYY